MRRSHSPRGRGGPTRGAKRGRGRPRKSQEFQSDPVASTSSAGGSFGQPPQVGHEEIRSPDVRTTSTENWRPNMLQVRPRYRAYSSRSRGVVDIKRGVQLFVMWNSPVPEEDEFRRSPFYMAMKSSWKDLVPLFCGPILEQPENSLSMYPFIVPRLPNSRTPNSMLGITVYRYNEAPAPGNESAREYVGPYVAVASMLNPFELMGRMNESIDQYFPPITPMPLGRLIVTELVISLGHIFVKGGCDVAFNRAFIEEMNSEYSVDYSQQLRLILERHNFAHFSNYTDTRITNMRAIPCSCLKCIVAEFLQRNLSFYMQNVRPLVELQIQNRPL